VDLRRYHRERTAFKDPPRALAQRKDLGTFRLKMPEKKDEKAQSIPNLKKEKNSIREGGGVVKSSRAIRLKTTCFW